MDFKIALLTDGIYPHVLGGMQKHSFFLAKYFARAKVRVDVYHYLPNSGDSYINEFELEELSYIRFYVVDYPSICSFPGHYLYERYAYSINILKQLKPHISEYSFIYCKGFAGWALLNIKKSYNNLPPIGINFHGFEMFQKWPSVKTGLQMQLLKRPVMQLVSKADVVFSYGGKVTEVILSNTTVGRNQIIEIPSGISRNWMIPVEEVKENDSILKFIFVGRYERRKGIEEIHEAIESLGSSLFEFHFVGPIPDEKQLLHPFVKYHGVISSTRALQDLLRQMDVLVCPSYSEGMPNVILEGMASGLAIIATDVGATNLLLKENGWLLDSKSIKLNLQKVMMNVIDMDKEVLYKMKVASIKSVEYNFLWDKVIDRTINEIRRVIGN